MAEAPLAPIRQRQHHRTRFEEYLSNPPLQSCHNRNAACRLLVTAQLLLGELNVGIEAHRSTPRRVWLVGSGSGEMHGPRRRLLGATDKRSRPGAAGLVNVLLTFAHWGLSGVTRVTFLAATSVVGRRKELLLPSS